MFWRGVFFWGGGWGAWGGGVRLLFFLRGEGGRGGGVGEVSLNRLIEPLVE